MATDSRANYKARVRVVVEVDVEVEVNGLSTFDDAIKVAENMADHDVADGLKNRKFIAVQGIKAKARHVVGTWEYSDGT